MQNEKNSCISRRFLFRKKRNRASGTELERTLHISVGLALRKQVNRLRCKEHPIVGDRSGSLLCHQCRRGL